MMLSTHNQDHLPITHFKIITEELINRYKIGNNICLFFDEISELSGILGKNLNKVIYLIVIYILCMFIDM
jgi:hypothetical protein